MRRFPFNVAAGMFAALTMAGVLVTAAPAAFASTTSTASATGVSYSGDAYAVGLQNVTVLGSPVNSGALLGDTGQLPASGGTVTAPLGTIRLPGNLGSVTVTGGTVTGAGGAANASEKVAGLSLLDNLTCTALGSIGSSNLPLLGSALNQLVGTGVLGGGSSGGVTSVLGGLLGGVTGCSGSTSTSGGGLLSGLLGGLLGGTSASTGTSGSGCILGLVCLGGSSGTGSTSGIVSGLLPDLVDVGLIQSSAGAAAPGVTAPPGGLPYPYEDSNVGTISLLGGAVNIPINPAPNTVINLGILSITLNQQSYDAATNTASAQALVLNFPTGGLLSAIITGTITVSSSTADTSGALSCPSGITVDSVSPTTGPVGGGTPVTITGTNFASGATVAFGSSPANNVNVVSSTQITATSPAHAKGTVVVSVNNCPNSPALFTYTTSAAMRFGGGNRIETAIKVSQAAFPGTGSASSVTLASDLDYQDGLVGVPLAAQKHGPLLLTEPTNERNGINPQVLAEIERVLTPHANKPVYLLGGHGVLSPNIDSTLAGLGYDPIRLAGSNLYSTAVDVANAQGDPPTVFLVTALDFADGLSAGPAAIHQSGVILYTDGTSMAPETSAYLAAHPGDSVFTVGGPAATADPQATPIVGADEFATDTLVAAFFGNPAVVGVARGDLFPDALDGGTMVATNGGPIILVNPNLPVPTASTNYFVNEQPHIQTVDVFGGYDAVSQGVCNAINTDLGTPGSC
jgi:hypothetical protein